LASRGIKKPLLRNGMPVSSGPANLTGKEFFLCVRFITLKAGICHAMGKGGWPEASGRGKLTKINVNLTNEAKMPAPLRSSPVMNTRNVQTHEHGGGGEH
jgi:hypothetical protein